MTTSLAGRHPLRTVLLVLVGLLIFGGGIAFWATDHGKALLPTLEQPTLNISNITRERIKGQFSVKLRSHAPIDLQIDSLRYEARLDGKRLVQGHKARPLVLKGNAMSHLTLPLSLDLAQIKQTAKTVQRDCVTVQLHTILYANLPGVGPKEILVEVRKRVYIPKLPKIEVADVAITKLGLKKGEAIVRLRMTNFETIPFTVKQVTYRLQLEDDLDVKGQETKDVTFKKKGIELMPIHVKFEPKAMPKVLFKTIFKSKKTDYKLTGSAIIAAGPTSTRDATMNFNSNGTVKELKELAKGTKNK